MPLDKNDFSEPFVEKMRRRMLTSLHKYGRVADNVAKFDFVKCAEDRIRLYKETGNTEWLVDAGNFLMMEGEFPKHPNAHFRATSSAEAPKRVKA